MVDTSSIFSPAAQAAVESLTASPAVMAAVRQAEAEHERRIADQVRLTEVPSPPFHEDERAEVFAQMLREAGLPEVHRDAVGNVIGRLEGVSGGPVLVAGAHLDTVFPEGTDVTVTREGTKYFAPGISDDDCGLACLLQAVRSITDNGIRTCGDIVFVGTLGEEGNGDLRGAKALFREKNDYDGFISVDSAAPTRLLTGSVGSRRFRISYDGPGGHSFHKFGKIASASHALCRLGAKIAALDAPADPKCTFTIGVIQGGTTVNAIAAHAEMQLDVRGYEQPALERFVERILPLAEEAALEENAHWGVEGAAAVRASVVPIGDRPAGANRPGSPVLGAAYAAMQALGIPLEKLSLASTDQNIALFHGLPATTLGGGGTEDNNHALNEWWDSSEAWLGPQLLILAALALVGVEGVSAPVLEKLQH